MLDAHPDLAIPGETHFLANLFPHDGGVDTADQFIRVLTDAPTWPNLATNEQTLRRAVGAIKPFQVSEAIRQFYRVYAEMFGKTRWGDKTPPYRSCMIPVEQLVPEAHFIHVIRDGRDVALSYRGLWFGPGDAVDAQARFWVEQIGSARTQANKLRHYLEVRYERLVTDPVTTLREICAFIELPFHPAMLQYWKSASTRLGEYRRSFGPPGTPTDIESFIAIHEHTKQPPDPGRIGRWHAEMSDLEQQQYEAIAGPLLRELGYNVRFSTD
jgi:hypothetical protein